MPLPRCWTIPSSNSPIPPPTFPSTNYPQFPNFRRPRFRHHRHQIFGKEEVTEIVYFRLIWVCAILSAFTILCAAIFCFQLLRLPAEIDFKMKRSLANCETFISHLQSNIIQIHTRIHHLGRKRRKVPSSTSQNRTSSSQNVVPLLDAEGKFCCIPGAPGTNGKNGVPGRSGKPGKIGKPGNPGKMNPNDAILVAAFGMCGRQIKMEENIGKKMGNCVQSCLKGEPGKNGPRGLKGDKGFRGDPGEPGRNGLIGQCGPKGAKGSRGAPGMSGDKGDQISKPERGDPGPIGPPGDAGPMGSPGLRGATRIGQKGQKGAKGQTRPAGPPGLQGIEGIRGPNGLPGLCPRNCELPKEMANRQIAGVVIGGGENVDGEERQKLVDQEERELAEYEGGMHDELWTTRVEKK